MIFILEKKEYSFGFLEIYIYIYIENLMSFSLRNDIFKEDAISHEFCRKWDFFFLSFPCFLAPSFHFDSTTTILITSTTITTPFQMSLPLLFLLPPLPPHHYLMQERSDNLRDNYVSGKCYLFYVSKHFLFVIIIWLKLFMEFS